METVRTIATLLPLALTSGINLYATVFIAGLSIRYQWVQGTPSSLDLLASWPVILVSGTLFVLESLAGVIPFVDNLWDIIHTLIRPLGMAMIGFIVLGNADPMVIIMTVLAVGSITLVTHGGKAGGRLAMNIATPFENFTNIGLSSVENIFAGGLTFFALQYPYIASGIAVIVFILILIFTPMLMRWSWFTASSFLVKLKSLFSKVTNPDMLPAEHLQNLGYKKPEMVVLCRAQSIKGANGRSGYVSKYETNLTFNYKAWFSTHVWRIDTRQIFSVRLQPRMFMDVLELHYYGAKRKIHIVRFVFLKDRSPLAQSLAQSLIDILRSRKKITPAS